MGATTHVLAPPPGVREASTSPESSVARHSDDDWQKTLFDLCGRLAGVQPPSRADGLLDVNM
jgi:hypothetical protein